MIEQQAYYQIHGWGWVWLIYFFGVLIAFCASVFLFDDLTYSKRKKFTWSAMVFAIILAAFSWIGLIAMIKFDNKHNGNNYRY